VVGVFLEMSGDVNRRETIRSERKKRERELRGKRKQKIEKKRGKEVT
jgi:hypothetical protein